jgi:hypothetical protein
MRAEASGAGARARVGIRVGDCLPRSSRAETAEPFASANTCPPSLSPSLPLVRARIYFDSSLPPRRRSGHQPGSAWLKRGRPLRARRIFCAASVRGGGAGCRAARGGDRDDEQERAWARAGHAKRNETDAFSSRAAVACRYPTFVLQMVPKRKLTRWILQTDPRGLKTDPPAYNAFGSCRLILQRNLNLDPAGGSSSATSIWILPTHPPEHRCRLNH